MSEALNRGGLSEWLPPPLLAWSLFAAGQIGFFRREKSLFLKNRALAGVAKGKRAFLLATGPSLKSEDLSLLRGEDCFSLSNFFLHDELEAVNPLFHFLPPYHEPLVLENYLEWLKEADRRLPSSTAIVLGHQTFPMVEAYGLFPGRKVHYLYLSSWLARLIRLNDQRAASFSKGVNLVGPVPSPQSGPLMILPVLLYMGYSRIYLLGCDHNVFKDYGKPIEHFYPNERDPRLNASSATAWSGILEDLDNFTSLLLQYRFYQQLASSSGVEFVNLSQGSWLDFLPFDRLDGVVKK